MNMSQETVNPAIPFRAETRQLLNILIHSLYSEREVFLRELISNASDALSRLQFEMLTNRNVLDPDAELAIRIETEPENRVLKISDTGIGMTAEEMVENLGTIAHSGAKAFLEAAQTSQQKMTDIIGQFGVGFYSAFMVAEWIRVISRTFRPEGQGAVWFSRGEDSFTVEPAERANRGTTVEIKLREDAQEFTRIERLREIIKKHSDYIPFPIYLGSEKEPVNQRMAIWRKASKEITQEEAYDFYRQFTLEVNPPLAYTHLNVDAPVQLYALLFIPPSPERGIFSLRKEDGLKLFARKVLIQEYCRDLLPDFLRFIQGVVDSEDLPLNVSRETLQASPLLPHLRRLITHRVLDMIRDLSTRSDDYAKFWNEFRHYIKEGIISNQEFVPSLTPLLRFPTLFHPNQLVSLDEYLQNKPASQDKIYYILGDHPLTVQHSPHLDIFRHQGIDVLLMTDPLDGLMMLSMLEYQNVRFANASKETPFIPPTTDGKAAESLGAENVDRLLKFMKQVLADKVEEVRVTNRLVDSPARLVSIQPDEDPTLQHVYRVLQKEVQDFKKALEINPSHPIIKKLAELPENDPRLPPLIEQIYENILLAEGIHPNPPGMIKRIEQIMLSSLE